MILFIKKTKLIFICSLYVYLQEIDNIKLYLHLYHIIFFMKFFIIQVIIYKIIKIVILYDLSMILSLLYIILKYLFFNITA